VRIEPTKDDYRKYLKHVPTGLGFPAEGPATWPDDRFTARRIADGSVTIVEDSVEDRPREDAQREHRTQRRHHSDAA
jgi:hypothetical protein